jgi:hypothetical protein
VTARALHRLVLVAAAVVVFLAAAAGRAAAERKPEKRDALVFLRVLAYDKQLTSRPAGEPVVVAVMYAAGSKTATAERDAWLAALAGVKKVKVGGRTVIATAVPYENAAALDRQLADLDPAAVILCAGLVHAIADIRTATRSHKVLSFSRAEADARSGLAVAVVSGDKRDEIVINLRAARAEGVKFDAGLLQLARLVEER